jgi:hypothetical protein
MKMTEAIVERVNGGDAGRLLVPMTNLAAFKKHLDEFQEFVKGYLVESKEGTTDGDYGTIPGTKKPTIFKSGAEKLCEVYGMAPDPVILDKVENYETGLFDYLIKVNLTSRRDGSFLGSGIGSCSSYESKYRYRYEGRKCPTCGAEAIRKGAEQYGGGWYCNGKAGGCGSKFLDTDQRITSQKTGKVTNPDMADVKNTVLKMAKKRALVDGTLSVTRSSSIFAQDLDDMAPGVDHGEGQPVQQSSQQPAAQPQKPATATTQAQAQAAPKERAKAPAATRQKAPAPTTKAEPAKTAAPAAQAAPAQSTLPKAQIPPAVPATNGKPKELKVWAQELAVKAQCSPDQLAIFLKRVVRDENGNAYETLKGAPNAYKVVALNALEHIIGMTWPSGLNAVTAFIRNEGLDPDFKAVETAYADLVTTVSDQPPTA